MPAAIGHSARNNADCGASPLSTPTALQNANLSLRTLDKDQAEAVEQGKVEGALWFPEEAAPAVSAGNLRRFRATRGANWPLPSRASRRGAPSWR